MSDDNQIGDAGPAEAGSPETGEQQAPAAATAAAPAEASVASAPVAEIDKLRKELEDSRQQADSFRRHAAELDNIRKRLMRERERDLAEKHSSVLRGMLPVVDNFERAMASLSKATDAEAVKVGTEQIYRLFVDWLGKQGVKPIPALGQKYDPNLHEAVMQMASTEVPEGFVSSELEKGYFLGERVLRHSKVVVSKGAQSAPSEADKANGGEKAEE